MKQITSNTILKQGNKSHPAIQTKQGIVWIDKDAEIKEGWKGYAYKKDLTGQVFKHFYTTNPWYNDAKIIIAANFELEGVPKVELEDEDIDTESIQKELGTWGHDEGLTEQEYKEWQSFNSIKEITVNENFKQI